MMRKIVCAVLALLLAAPAFAQGGDAATAAAVKDLMVAMKLDEIIAASSQQYVKAVPALMRQAAEQRIKRDPAMPEAVQQKIRANTETAIPTVTKVVSEMMNDPALKTIMMTEFTNVYARHFTLAEIKAIRAFYVSPVGAKMLVKMPEVMAEIGPVLQRTLGPRLEQAMQAVSSELGK